MATSSALKIVIVGGGSNAWTPAIVRDMLLTPGLADSQFVLYDIRREASDLTAAFLEKLAEMLGARARFLSTDDRPTALEGADYVVITISTGGLDAMEQDLAIAERFGVRHTVGDTSGPGGWARFIRNFDVFLHLAQDINRLAPRAVVLNYTNPMTTLTDVLARVCRGPVVGLCHGLFENLEFLQRFYRLDSEADLSVQYAGVNHFFWITQARAAGVDLLADLNQRLRQQTFTDLLRQAEGNPPDFHAHREVATELMRLTGVMPYLGDRHTCEFFPWYIANPDTLQRYRLVRTTVAERRQGFAQREADLKAMIAGTIPDAYRRRTRETAADIIAAHSQGKTFIDVGNVPNQGQVANLPRGAVVETAVRVDRNGFTPLAFGDLPPVVAGLVTPWCRVFSLVVDACFQGNLALALQALRLDPTTSHLDGRQVRDLGETLLGAHRGWVRCFA